MIRSWTRPGDWVLLALVLLPLAIAAPRLLDDASNSIAGWTRTLASASGVLGLSAILVAGALSARVPGFDRFFGGLTRLWHLHHILGFSGFLLVMLHVVLLAAWGVSSSVAFAVSVVFPELAEWAVWTGWAAFMALVVFLAPSFKFFGEPHYQSWKRLHLVSALALLLAVVHAIPLASETIYWWVLAIFGIGAIVWRKIGSRLATRRLYEITAVEHLAPGMVEISFQPMGRPVRYAAGQFVYLSPTDPALAAGHNEEHPYSVSSSPKEDVLRIGIRDLGDASHALQTVAIGSQAWIEGPYGAFFERLCPERQQLWIGGGVGITPFVGGARSLAASEVDGNVHLIHLSDSPERAYYTEELKRIAADTNGFAVTPHYFRTEGPLSVPFLQATCADFAEREVYVCGSPTMLGHVRSVLRQGGVPGYRIHSEEFNLL